LASISWFCKSKIPTTFYVVREQANLPKREGPGETKEDLFKALSSDPYINSCLIVHDLSHSRHRNKVFSYHNALDQLPGQGIVVKDIKSYHNDSGIEKWKKTDIYNDGIIHGQMSINGILHLAINMKYKQVLFAGVDLRDSRYFWLGDKTRHTVKNKGQKAASKHAIAEQTMELLRETKRRYKIDMQTISRKSMLKKIMPIWN